MAQKRSKKTKSKKTNSTAKGLEEKKQEARERLAKDSTLGAKDLGIGPRTLGVLRAELGLTAPSQSKAKKTKKVRQPDTLEGLWEQYQDIKKRLRQAMDRELGD